MGLTITVIKGGVMQSAYNSSADTDNLVLIDVDNLKAEGKSEAEVNAIIKTMTLLLEEVPILDYRELTYPGIKKGN